MKSSIWVALAWDAAHGEFYRPVISAIGYGGTRYMPLLFLLHAALLKLGFDPIWSGVVLMQMSVVAAAFALYVALRTVEVDRATAAPLALLVWGTIIFQQSCTDLNPDYLAAALVLLAAVTGPVAGAVLLILAGLTKITAVAFAVPIALAHRSTRHRISFVMLTSAGLGVALLAIEAWSAGNFHRAFLVAAFAGATWHEARDAVPQFFRELAIKPFDIGVPFAVACWCAWKRGVDWSSAYLMTASLVAIAIFTTPGTASNHLVDLHLASLLLVGGALSDGTLRPRIGAAVFGALAVMIAAITIPLPGLPSVVADIRSAGPRPRAAVVDLRHDAPAGTWLSFDPIVPILNGQRPWVLDYSNLEFGYSTQTMAGRDVKRRVEEQFFDAVIVPKGYDSPLVQLVTTAYAPQGSQGLFTVFLPRQCWQQPRSLQQTSGLTGLPSGPNPRCVSTHQ